MVSRWIVAAALCGIVVGTAGPVAAQAGRAGTPGNTLTVSGDGQAKAAPDVAYVSVGVVTQGKRAQEASQANAAATQKVIAALKALGIADRDIQTSNYMVQPRTENRPGQGYGGGIAGGVIVGYDVSNTVRATVRKLANVGAALDAALEAGANNVQGLSFGLEAREQAEGSALEDAVRTARRKADVLARAAGVRITGVRSMQEGATIRPMPFAGDMVMSAAKVATPVEPGELTVTAQVTVVYTITAGERTAGMPAARPAVRAARR